MTSEELDGTGTAPQYAAAITAGIITIHDFNLTIGSVVVDGGTAQLKALGTSSGMAREKLKKAIGDQGQHKFIVIPPLAEIALRLQPAPASEASAERAISLQRLIMTARRNRTAPELIEEFMNYF